MDALDKSDAIEQATLTRVADIYAAALRQALKQKKAFLQKIRDVEKGKIKPPLYYIQRSEEDKWRQGFYRELIRQNAVIDGILKELDKAGVESAKLIRKSMTKIYQAHRDEVVDDILREVQRTENDGLRISFATYSKQQIDVLISEGESPFSQIAYNNLGSNSVARRRLQNELAIATILGEGQKQIIERIRKVTEQTVAQARRVAQTERTRVQSQARWQVGQEAAEQGIEIENTWSARMIRTRDTHQALNGMKRLQGIPFTTVDSDGDTVRLLYPGDPSAPAKEVINCFCVLVPHVARKGVGSHGSKPDVQG